MKTRIGSVAVLIIVAFVAASAPAGATARSVGEPIRAAEPLIEPAPVADDLPTVPRKAAGVRGAVLAGTPSPAPTLTARHLVGIASNYPGTAGWIGLPTVALPGELGGRYDGEVNGHVTVCADRCARLPAVDWCQCYWGTSDERIVDLSHPAWALVSDAAPAEGLIEVRLIVEPGLTSRTP